MSTRILLLCTAFAAAVAGTGCTKQPLDHISQDESRIYITNFDSTANFKSYNTYTISDSVAVISDQSHKMESGSTDQAYLAAVKKYMQQQGYTYVARTANPDLAVNVNRIYNTTSGVISYGDYWDYYGGYWDPFYYGYGGYGYGIPYYGYSVYSITEGAMSVDLLDLKNAAAKKEINIIWTGLIRGSGIFNTSVADAQVQALFTQSPYLTNK
ncbi:DUF4136 domain-containing protein [Deminuibacter soli]|uniref:DUF4136 domain-containing protein n=1 Tax=Deminuibacter soli TaxID=2291815 RepID=A0A3E1NE27_9BACT|nr:DUF4136 domain-containing protein [Deminuibacter soli]RFM26216.1 DUF4136 domain-containing protein [Deminuibacter soli]